MSSKLLFLLLLAILLPGRAIGSDVPILPQDLDVRVWTSQQGLPDDSVTAVLQTRDGYLWVGTTHGLVRFDGVRFVPLVPGQGSSNVVSITALCEDMTGALWIGTQEKGLMRYVDGVLSEFHPAESLQTDSITSIAQDLAGQIWLGTPAGVICLRTNGFIRYTSRDGLPNDFVSSVNVARSGTVWITTRGGMCQFRNGRLNPYPFRTDSPGRNPESLGVYEDRRGNLWAFGDTYLVNLNEGKYLNHFGSGDMTSSTRIWSLCEGRNGELWIGTSGRGLYFFSDNQFVPVTLRTGGLSSDVRALCEDREGNLWLGTHGGGLIRLQPRNMRLLDSAVGLPDRPALCLSVGPAGRLNVGVERGGVLEEFGNLFQKLPGRAGTLAGSLVSTLVYGPDSSLWVGTPGTGLYRILGSNVVHYTTANGLADDHVRALALDSHNVVWAGTDSGGLHQFVDDRPRVFGPESGIPSSAVTALIAARKASLWVGMDNGVILQGSDSEFKMVIDSETSGSRAITALHEDTEGRLWIGTAGGRLACLAGRFLTWDLKLGSPEHALRGILRDDEGNLWLSTAAAVYHCNARDVAASVAEQGSLRPQIVFKTETASGAAPTYGWPRAVRTAQGKMWFALLGGVAAFDLRAPATDLLPPPVIIEEIVVNNRPLVPFRKIKSRGPQDVPAPVRLPSDLSSLGIQFTAVNLSAPERIRIRYRLDGHNSDWVTGGEVSRNVLYDRLPYGSYTFRVQAGTEGGWFDEEAIFAFIRPIPLWRTDWAIGGYLAFAVALVATLVRVVSHRRLRRRLSALAAQQAMERERMRIAQDMHDEIGSKLTKISFMSERAIGELDGQGPVADKLDSIARTSRDLLQSLDEIVWAVNPHNDTLEHLAAYLGQYATEYLQNTAVQCDLRIQRGLPTYPLSAEARHNLFLAFEESLNNALKHGQPSRVQIEMMIERSRFWIKMEDNGRGFDSRALEAAGGRQGNGLRNMRQRLTAVGGQFDIQSSPDCGTRVVFSVPLDGRPVSPRKK